MADIWNGGVHEYPDGNDHRRHVHKGEIVFSGPDLKIQGRLFVGRDLDLDGLIDRKISEQDEE